MRIPLLCLCLLLPFLAQAADPLAGAKRILFLGDSITYSGEYVDDFEAALWLEAAPGQKPPEIIDAALPSETVSGLSEPGHAEGKFPRPDLHERLARVLAKVHPDLIIACYGINDGIYLPLDEERFARYREGMTKLHAAAEQAGARIIHLTPPVFDPVAGKAAGYDDVMVKYSAWLMEQRQKGWVVIDLHTRMAEALAAGRKRDPGFRYAKDGVHPNAAGHRVMADALLTGLGRPRPVDLAKNPAGAALLKAVREQERILTNAWLTDTGHQRPGMAQGLPLAEAQAKAAALEPRIEAAVQAVRKESK